VKIFDRLTKFLDCNGTEAFKGVRKFNEKLLMCLGMSGGSYDFMICV